MNKNQLDVIEELKTTLERCRREGLLLIVDNNLVHAAEYKALDANGFYAIEDREDAERHALSLTPHETFEPFVFDVIN